MMPARTAAAAPTSSEPRLVVKRFWAISTTSNSSLFRHHDDARIDAVWITRLAVVPAELAEVEDEMPDDQACVVVRRSIVRMWAVVVRRRAWVARIVEATAVAGVTGDIKVSESCDRHGA